MNSIQIPIGISDFERIRENNYCYIYNRDLLIDMLKEQKDLILHKWEGKSWQISKQFNFICLIQRTNRTAILCR